jgi:diaminohydroxyphosphoribosylaminopyrimidine deaminase/5-amino-6-(5-phosphoribosylamino)uracil reductase
MDAIIVGAGTVRHDDPLLTARPAGARTLFRIVLASAADVPLQSQLIASARQSPVIVVAGLEVEPARRQALENAGCEILIMPALQGRPQIGSLLEELGRRQMTNVVVEGGNKVLGAFFDAEEIDEVHVYIAPILIGGEQAPMPIGGSGVARLADALELDQWSCRALDRDYVIEAKRSSGTSGLPITRNPKTTEGNRGSERTEGTEKRNP